MKKLLLFVCVIVVFFSACAKKEMGCTPVVPKTEEPAIMAYATANGVQFTKHSKGIYYNIVDSGSGVSPTPSSKVYVTYTGKFLDGRIFEEKTSTVNFLLTGVIEGWQIGIPLIKKGGKIKLIIPSSYGYGCIDKTGETGNVVIPANSVLYYDVSLVDVK